MNLQQFILKYKGKRWDFDGAYGNQCMDLYRFYVRDVWQKPQTAGVKGAFQVFDTIDAKVYDKIKYSAGKMPQAGDVITWSEKLVKNGHIAIVEAATPLLITVFDQNNPQGNYSTTHAFSYKNVIGWFRPKTNNNVAMKLPMIKFNDDNTVFLQAGISLFPFASEDAMVHAGGSFADVILISHTERGKYDIRMESPIIKYNG